MLIEINQDKFEEMIVDTIRDGIKDLYAHPELVKAVKEATYDYLKEIPIRTLLNTFKEVEKQSKEVKKDEV